MHVSFAPQWASTTHSLHRLSLGSQLQPGGSEPGQQAFSRLMAQTPLQLSCCSPSFCSGQSQVPPTHSNGLAQPPQQASGAVHWRPPTRHVLHTRLPPHSASVVQASPAGSWHWLTPKQTPLPLPHGSWPFWGRH